jgi:thiol-disulfide isomerase/thioredoxin
MMNLNRDNTSAFLTGIAVVSLIVGFAIYFNTPELNSASSGENGANFVSNVALDGSSGKITKTQYSIDKSQFRKAPEFMGISGYINTSPLTLKELKGKVVLVDFWTYSCINCIRTLPYLVDWNAKYSDEGLVIVGVHTPEFEFEKNTENVKAAVEKFGIKYPVFQDNDKGTWNAYDNSYWPRKYIIDSEGYIRYDHIGEGGYSETEKVIQTLLAERAALNGEQTLSFNSNGQNASTPTNIESVDFSRVNSPELYFGYQYARDVLGSPQGFRPDQVVNYSIPSSDLRTNVIYLQGEWKNNPDNLELDGDSGKIALAYSAKSVNIVAGGSGEASVSEDGIKSIRVDSTNSTGSDIGSGGQLIIDGQRLYNIAKHQDYGNHYIVLDVKGKGFQAYTFTFG